MFFWLDDPCCLTPRPFDVTIFLAHGGRLTLYNHFPSSFISFVLAVSRSFLPSSLSLFFKSCRLLRHLFLASASLKFDSRLNSSIFLLASYLERFGFLLSITCIPVCLILHSLITLAISPFTSTFRLHTSLHYPPTNSISILNLSSFRFVCGSGVLNIRKKFSLFFLSLISFTVSSTTFPLFWVVCRFLLSSSFGLHV